MIRHFEAVITECFRRNRGGETQVERRPHIVGLDEEGRNFIIQSRTNRSLNNILGPLYIGGTGETEVLCHHWIEDGWHPSLRFGALRGVLFENDEIEAFNEVLWKLECALSEQKAKV